MGLASVFSRAIQGLNAPLVTIEVHVSGGLPAVNMVGLPEAAVREARDRVRSAIQNSGFEFPASRITVNMAPADLPKEGTAFDLPIAVGILAASGQINVRDLADVEILGELALNGEVRPVRGALPVAMSVVKGGRALVLPSLNTYEAALVEGLPVYAARHLSDVVAALNSGNPLERAAVPSVSRRPRYALNMADVRGQQQVKRGLMVAAAGGHNVLMEGPPGSGKSMLAKRLPSILPCLTNAEALEVAAVRSLVGEPFELAQFSERPYRTVNASASLVALLGGAKKPGEISLGHYGVVFLDEAIEFSRNVLEALRDPLENGYIDVARADFRYRYPAKFQLVLAMNPCPCGDPENCRDTPDQITRYRAKLSVPILDRIDIHLHVPRVKHQELIAEQQEGLTSEVMRQQVDVARERQLTRQGKANVWLSANEIDKYSKASQPAADLLKTAMSKMNLTARGYHRMLKVARSIADLAASDEIELSHMAEAIAYRQVDS